MKSKNSILITGIAGFIAFNLANKLLEENANINIIGIDNLNDYYDVDLKKTRIDILSKYNNFRFIKESITNKEFIDKLFSKYNFDIVINLAAQAGVRYSIENPDIYVESNIIGFYNILEACRHSNIKHLIYASSSSVYGENTIPFNVNDRTDSPISLYAATKKCDEILAYSYHKLYNISCTGLRFFTVYGPYGRPDMAYYDFTKKILNNKKIKVFNHGKSLRDFTYIDDVVNAIINIINSKPNNYKIYNIGNSNPINLMDFINILVSTLKNNNLLSINYDIDNYIELVYSEKADVENTYADMSEYEKDFGKLNKTNIDEGLDKFIKWYSDYYKCKKMKITVVGLGYVGLSLATLLSTKNDVIGYDIDNHKLDLINKKILPIKDEWIEKYFKEKELNLSLTSNYQIAFRDSDYIIICTNTNYDEETKEFNTNSIEENIRRIININPKATIIIKSTVPIGFTERMRTKYNYSNIIFSPEFLREDHALYDNLYPSRIIVGDTNDKAKTFANLLKEVSLKEDVQIKYMNSTEAEAVKLFSNTYLALRIAFFNELDTFCEINNLDSKLVIEGVCLDPRIGNYYNNPSFGYGGYCLPKDTKQLYSNFKDIPQNIIEAIIKSNMTRKKHIVDKLKNEKDKTIGIYRLTMKADSDNYRESAILDIIDELKKYNINLIIYEPLLNNSGFNDYKLVDDLTKFNEESDIIVVNRPDENIKKLTKKIYTRNIFDKD